MTALLEVDAVHKRFGGVQALRGVSLRLPEGEVVGLIGPNGSGKTTLINVVAGGMRPSAGAVRLDGRRIERLPSYHIVRRGIAKTHQIPRPFLAMTARENVAVAALYGARGHRDLASARDEAARTLGLVGLEARAEAPAASLTVQERKRLEFARAIATGARILLLDEIFAGQSPDELRASLDLFTRVQKELGFGALVVEHVMRAVLTLAHRVVVLEEGQVIAEGPPREVVKDRAVIEAYLGTEVT